VAVVVIVVVVVVVVVVVAVVVVVVTVVVVVRAVVVVVVVVVVVMVLVVVVVVVVLVVVVVVVALKRALNQVNDLLVCYPDEGEHLEKFSQWHPKKMKVKQLLTYLKCPLLGKDRDWKHHDSVALAPSLAHCTLLLQPLRLFHSLFHTLASKVLIAVAMMVNVGCGEC